MATALRRHNIAIKRSGIQGHGVFAEADIEPGEIIEECYSLTLKDSQDLVNYTFKLDKKGLEEYVTMPLGYGAVFNHSTDPNAEYEFDRETLYMVFTASKPIKAGEEIFISYGDHWFACRDTTITQASFSFQLKRLFFHDTFYRRLFLVTAAIILLLLLISGGS
jgi:uncharacterized protein